MRVLMINCVCGIRSTGRICTDLAAGLEAEGHEVKIAYGRVDVPERYQRYAVRIGGPVGVGFHWLGHRLFDGQGFGSRRATARFLAWAEAYDPDMLWLHNIHGYYINIEMLFAWIKSRPGMKVKWTLHDCWAFTGHCFHFSVAKCDKWKTHCEACPQRCRKPLSADRSRENYDRKKAAFTGVGDMTLITPSRWLAELVGQSFLGQYPIEVRHNTVDTAVFRPTPGDFRGKHGLEGKKLILGVASAWSAKKGLNDLIKLSEMLDGDYVTVLVGLSRKQLKALPGRIVGIPRTNDVTELAELYTAADLFVNPSREETFGMTTLEALSCGTDAMVYKDTACEEVVARYGGIAVEPDVNALYRAIRQYFEEKTV